MHKIKWGNKLNSCYRYPLKCPEYKALITQAFNAGYIKDDDLYLDIAKTVKIDRFLRDFYRAELRISEKTDNIIGIDFKTRAELLMFTLRSEPDE